MLKVRFAATLFITAIVFLASACAGFHQLAPDQDPNCGNPARIARFQFSSNIFRQSSTLSVKAVRDNSPAGEIELTGHCSTGWGVQGPAKLANKHRNLVIDARAPVGSKIVVFYRTGSQAVRRTITVIKKDAVVLTGWRRQTSIEGCANATEVGELEFTDENAFAVTFSPFETYKDYWGSYRFDQSTGSIVMTVEGGNMIPEGLKLDRQAHFEGEHLVLDGLFLGNRDPGSMVEPVIENDQLVGWRKISMQCRYTF